MDLREVGTLGERWFWRRAWPQQGPGRSGHAVWFGRDLRRWHSFGRFPRTARADGGYVAEGITGADRVLEDAPDEAGDELEKAPSLSPESG